jgi:hypothetical protein
MLEEPLREALTFDDVLLVPQKSHVLPTDVDLVNEMKLPTERIAVPIRLTQFAGPPLSCSRRFARKFHGLGTRKPSVEFLDTLRLKLKPKPRDVQIDVPRRGNVRCVLRKICGKPGRTEVRFRFQLRVGGKVF